GFATAASVQDLLHARLVAVLGLAGQLLRAARSLHEKDGRDAEHEEDGADDREERHASFARAVLDASFTGAAGLGRDRDRRRLVVLTGGVQPRSGEELVIVPGGDDLDDDAGVLAGGARDDLDGPLGGVRRHRHAARPIDADAFAVRLRRDLPRGGGARITAL